MVDSKSLISLDSAAQFYHLTHCTLGASQTSTTDVVIVLACTVCTVLYFSCRCVPVAMPRLLMLSKPVSGRQLVCVGCCLATKIKLNLSNTKWKGYNIKVILIYGSCMVANGNTQQIVALEKTILFRLDQAARSVCRLVGSICTWEELGTKWRMQQVAQTVPAPNHSH